MYNKLFPVSRVPVINANLGAGQGQGLRQGQVRIRLGLEARARASARAGQSKGKGRYKRVHECTCMYVPVQTVYALPAGTSDRLPHNCCSL